MGTHYQRASIFGPRSGCPPAEATGCSAASKVLTQSFTQRRGNQGYLVAATTPGVVMGQREEPSGADQVYVLVLDDDGNSRGARFTVLKDSIVSAAIL
jgi:hypothetical protein